MQQNKFDEVLFSRTEARFLKYEKADVGFSLVGPSSPVMKNLLDRGGMPLFLYGLIGLTKLHAVAIDKAHRGEGYGSLMVENAISRATKSGYYMIYGSFDSVNRPGLASFYQHHGFDVLQVKEPLSLELITGSPEGGIAPMKDERLFVKYLQSTA